MIDLATRLESWSQNEEMINQHFTEHGEDCKEAATELRRLQEKCNKQAMMLQRLMPDKFPYTPFIHSLGGTTDENGMPDRLYVVPAYGCDFSYVYERTEKTVGPEW